MDRRDFLLKTGRISAALTVAHPARADGKQASAAAHPAGRNGKLTLANDSVAWSFEWRDRKLYATSFENKLSGRKFLLTDDQELMLTFSAAEQRIEIPWWKFALGPDQDAVAAEQEQGFKQGFHQPDFQDSAWGVTENLLLKALSGPQHPPDSIRYDGYGWFRQRFELPVSGRDKEVHFVLGGHDQQDWNEYWVYVNGQPVGHRAVHGRWRTPGQFRLAPGDPAYRLLRFGESNVLAIRTRGFDKRHGGYSEEVLRHYVFQPFWADQFVTVGTPYMQVSDFTLEKIAQPDAAKVAFELSSTSPALRVTLHYELEGPTRRKWAEIANPGSQDLLLLDIQIDSFDTKSPTSEGGAGEPVFLAEQAFAALEHPAGFNQGDDGRIRLVHFPARRIQAGKTTSSHTALLSASRPGEALDHFTHYIQSRSPRKQRAISLYTPYGINNQWGGCPALNDVETLHILDDLEKWQQKGMKFEYFTLDQGWMEPTGDLTRFASQCFPNGAAGIAERVRNLGMKFGLWFSVTGAGWSCGENPAMKPSFIPNPGQASAGPPAGGTYRNGYLAYGGVPGRLCVASEPYFSTLRDAVLYHIKNNNLKFFKLDIGDYYCNSTEHQHLPGKYSVEASYEHLLNIAAAARQADPDVYVMWYWGVRSPFFALHGDSIFESNLFMEGSGTSWFPTLYYRDSVSLNLDQSTQFAKTIPAINKDSLGVWLADTRWGNFMQNVRWRESMVMDLGRGSLLFPQIWGDINLLEDKDVDFLREIAELAKKNEALFLHRRNILGDPWKNEVYGYAHARGDRGFLFINNVHFAARRAEFRLGPALGLDAAAGTPVEIVSHFPEKKGIAPPSGSAYRIGDVADIWLRPFEVLMVEVKTARSGAVPLPSRTMTAQQAAQMGMALPLEKQPPAEWMEVRFADAARFEQRGLKKGAQAWSTTLPDLGDEPRLLAIPVKLRQGNAEWRYSPTVVEIVQVVARIGDQIVHMIPVPDARDFGNTQNAGCSWVVYKLRLDKEWSGKKLEFGITACLPENVEALAEGWVVQQWWEEYTRPLGDGYYGDAPS